MLPDLGVVHALPLDLPLAGIDENCILHSVCGPISSQGLENPGSLKKHREGHTFEPSLFWRVIPTRSSNTMRVGILMLVTRFAGLRPLILRLEA